MKRGKDRQGRVEGKGLLMRHSSSIFPVPYLSHSVRSPFSSRNAWPPSPLLLLIQARIYGSHFFLYALGGVCVCVCVCLCFFNFCTGRNLVWIFEKTCCLWLWQNSSVASPLKMEKFPLKMLYSVMWNFGNGNEIEPIHIQNLVKLEPLFFH